MKNFICGKCIGLIIVLGIVSMMPRTANAVEGITTQSLIMSWNVCSKQFIDPPVFKLLLLPKTAVYRAEITQGPQTWTVSSKEPTLDLKKIWKRMAVKKFQLKLQWLDSDGKTIHEETSSRVKAPDFKGFKEPRADWAAAADRNVAYLIWAADHAKTSYREPGVPVWVWSSAPGMPIGYPCTMINFITWGFGHIENNGRYSKDALRLARAGADWALKYHTPDTGALPGFPYTTVMEGKLGGSLEGDAVSFLRASWLASSYVDLYEVTKYQPYLDYARHIANTSLKFQNPDGGFPYRVNPKTGAVVEMYNSNAMEFVELVEKLEPYGFDGPRAIAAQRAVEWLLAYPCATNNWKAIFEDVTPGSMYTNLTHMGVQPLVRYLCQHKDRDPSYLPTAKRLNRWMEDQFISFGIEDEALSVREKSVVMFEQYNCWAPMEAHAGHWIRTLIELHKATGERQYLDKAMAAANGICFDQYPDGEFSTWGRNWDTRRTNVENVAEQAGSNNWYNANACATMSLYKLVIYLKQVKGEK